MIVVDDIKIKYVREGYLPNWPYHLISNEEMCNAFLSISSDGQYSGYFIDNYPLVDRSLGEPYNNLVSALQYHINYFLSSTDPNATLPDWVYSYMLGNVISVNSDVIDIHNLLVLLNADNTDDIFTPITARLCYNESKMWIRKLPPDEAEHRPPTIFGELHVIKSLRLTTAADINEDINIENYAYR